MTTTFKVLYFPAARTRIGKPRRITLAIPHRNGWVGPNKEVIAQIMKLNSKQVREALGNPFLEDIEEKAQHDGRSLSNACLHSLVENLSAASSNARDGGSQQMRLPFDSSEELDRDYGKNGFGVTFRDSKAVPVHGWYPYVEGFSVQYVHDAILRWNRLPSSVYDPFGGAGTTQLAASQMGISSYYAEVNPFMRFVAETKITSAAWASQHWEAFDKAATTYLSQLSTHTLDKVGKHIDLAPYHRAFPERDFFQEEHLRQLLAAKQLAAETAGGSEHIHALFSLAVAANAVHSSNMTRRADLRRRRADEYKNRVVDVALFVANTIRRMHRDIRLLPKSIASTARIANDCRRLPNVPDEAFDFAITSPPYLNGTNYFRNTKIELWLLGFIQLEDELTSFRRDAICAGINNVSGGRPAPLEFAPVESVVEKLAGTAGDKRIPKMVRYYFSDMSQVMSETYRVLKQGARFVLDIGDSCFYGIHVRTDDLLAFVAESAGFSVEEKSAIADRYSKDRFQLKQYELVFRKPECKPRSARRARKPRAEEPKGALFGPASSRTSLAPDPMERIEEFAKSFPYKQEPYCRRNWGHGLHSLCSYQGKLKPAIAFWLVNSFVPPNGRVLDPLGGVGTVAFEAAMSGRCAVSNDKSPFASIVAAAKLKPPTLPDALQEIESLEHKLSMIQLSDSDFESAKFGLNASVAEYYHPKTLEEVLKARRIFLAEGKGNSVQTFLWASLLHVLHGNRPYALSRRSHPITPFNPTGPREYKSLIEKLRARVTLALDEPLPAGFVAGEGLNGDFRELPSRLSDRFDAIITSPPFLGMRFDRPNWLRMWFCGWSERSFHEDSLSFLERQQSRSMDCYYDFFTTCQQLLAPNGILIMHIGAGEHDHMPRDLAARATGQFILLREVAEDVRGGETHGLKDKGRTKAHHYLFFKSR